MLKLILTDLDHTLLRQDGSISEETLRVFGECRAKGILFAIATARYWIGAEQYIEQLKPDYEITTDGTLIHSRDQCIYSCAFSVSDTNRIIQRIMQAVPGAEITVANGKTVYTAQGSLLRLRFPAGRTGQQDCCRITGRACCDADCGSGALQTAVLPGRKMVCVYAGGLGQD